MQLILLFGSIFMMVVSAGMLIFNRSDASTASVVTHAFLNTPREKKGLSHIAASMGNLVERFEGIVPKSKSDVSLAQKKLIQAGYRNESAVRTYFGIRAVTTIVLPIIVYLTGVAQAHIFLAIGISLFVGYILPDIVLSKMISKRQKSIRLDLPDVLDILIVCVEAGLSLDQALSRTAEELGRSKAPIADELDVVVLEQRAGCSRSDAWRHFAERTNVPSVRNVVSMLIQAEQFGTSIARTLRVHSETMRTQRTQEAEEMAAKTGVKMLIPLILLIFPMIFVVAVGPAAIATINSFQNSLSH